MLSLHVVTFKHNLGLPSQLKTLLHALPECRRLPTNQFLNGRSLPTKALAKRSDDGLGIKWLAFAFETVSGLLVNLILIYYI